MFDFFAKSKNSMRSSTIGAARILSLHRKSTLICIGYPNHPKISILSQPSLSSPLGG